MKRTIKETHRALFLALQADAKEYPGGIRGLAEVIGINGNTLANGFNPDHEAQPPSFAVIVESIVLMQGKRSVFYMTRLVNQYPVDMDIDIGTHTGKQVVESFLTLVMASSNTLSHGSESAKDGVFDAKERNELEPLLLEMIKAATELLQLVRGG